MVGGPSSHLVASPDTRGWVYPDLPLARFPLNIWEKLEKTLKENIFFSMSVIILVGSDGGLIVELGGLRKKHLIGCQISSSKVFLLRFHKK